MNACLLWCHRPFTFALVFTFFHEVLSVTIGFVGSSVMVLNRLPPHNQRLTTPRSVPNELIPLASPRTPEELLRL